MRRSLALAVIASVLLVAHTLAQGMPDPRQVSGVPLPTTDLPVGSISVRVIRGSFANNLTGVPVDFLIDSKTRTVKTGADGRAEVSGLDVGAHVKAVAVVDGERLESQEMVVSTSGFRLVLTASDPNQAAAEAVSRAGAGAVVSGSVTIGPDSRIVADFSQDRLNLYYVVDVVNALSTPVDIGGPLVFTLPQDAQGPAILEGSSKQAVIQGSRVMVTGPFVPGSTSVQFAFEFPFSGSVAHVEEVWPAPLQTLSVIALRTGHIDLDSPQLTSKRTVTDQGQPIIAAQANNIAAGQPFAFDVTGLPFHPLWPRYTALAMAGVIMLIGIWAGFVPSRSRTRTA